MIPHHPCVIPALNNAGITQEHYTSEREVVQETTKRLYIILKQAAMALQMDTYLSGRVNNLVFFKRAGTYVVRTQAVAVKHSAATRIRSRNFGVAARTGKSLRPLLHPVLPLPKDRGMQIRLAGAFAKWLRLNNPATIAPTAAIDFVKDFQFNTSTTVAERWRVTLGVGQQVPDTVEVQIPAFVPAAQITAPADTALVACTITVAACLLATGIPLGSHTAHISIPFTLEAIDAQSIYFPVPTPAGAVVVTAVSLRYVNADGVFCTSPAFMPASVVDARYC